jgi:lysophospholipase L1-like esterase
MGAIKEDFGSTYRDWSTDGVESSGIHNPDKADQRALGSTIEMSIATLGLAGSFDIYFADKATMDADLAHAANTVALVYGDGAEAQNDFYLKTGASGVGNWVLTGTNGIIHDAVGAVAQPYVDQAQAAAAAAAGSAATLAASISDPELPDQTIIPLLGAKWGANDTATLLYLKDGKVDQKSVGPDAMQYIAENLGTVPTGNLTPNITDGSRMRRYRTGMAGVRLGGANRPVKVAFVAHSWGDRKAIIEEARNRYEADGIAVTATGWVSMGEYQQEAVVLAFGADWQRRDISDGHAEAAASPDGNCRISIASGTGADQQGSVSGIYGTDLAIQYHDTLGQFRYKPNGGAWYTVIGGNTEDTIEVTDGLTGLGAGPHTIEFDLDGNADTVNLTGIRAEADDVGVILYKLSNGQSISAHWLDCLPALATTMAEIQPDLVIMMMSVNDQKTAVTAAVTKENKQAILSAISAASPDTAVLLISEPRLSTDQDVGKDSYTLFGAADAELYAENDFVELIRFDQLWGTVAQEGAAGNDMYDGPPETHLIGTIAHRRFVGDFYDNFLRPYLAGG